MNKNFRQAVDDRLANVVLSDEAKEAIKVKAAVAAATPEAKKPIPFKRGLLTAVAACLAVAFSLSVAAAVFPDFEHFIRRMGEDLRGRVQPVEVAATDAGIRMDVLAAVHDGKSAILYLGLTDETGEGRIDAATELAWADTEDDFNCVGPLVDFDTETGTAIFRVEVAGYGEPLQRDMTLTLHSINTGVAMLDDVDTGITLADITAANPQPKLAGKDDFESGLGFGVSWGDDFDDTLPDELAAQIDAGAMPLLARDSAPLAPSTPDWLSIGAAGVVDGLLHVQYGPASDDAIYNHPALYLDWDGANGSRLASADITLEKHSSEGPFDFYSLSEGVFELPEGVPAEKVRLMLMGREIDRHITGEWMVSFTLDERTPELVATEVESGILTFKHITVSTIGLKADFRYLPGAEPGPADSREELAIYMPDELGQAVDFQVFLKDGTEVKVDSSGSGGDNNGNMTASLSFSRPIDIGEVDRVLLNGVELDMKYR